MLLCGVRVLRGGLRLRVGLVPGEYGEVFPVNGGQRKSWDVRLTFFADGAPDPKNFPPMPQPT
jgi:hypothetical protein